MDYYFSSGYIVIFDTHSISPLLSVPQTIRGVLIFDNLGPYHLARLRAASTQIQLLAIEVRGRSKEYEWEASKAPEQFQRVTLISDSQRERQEVHTLKFSLKYHLSSFNPSVVLIPGWSSRIAFVAIQWCTANSVPVVLMSESTAHDELRSVWKEAVKRRYVGMASAALVGGTLHADYLAKLGMPRERIRLGYDVVDNEYFANAKTQLTEPSSQINGVAPTNSNLPSEPPSLKFIDSEPRSTTSDSPYFLASARFIAKKNLPVLVRAYARYRALVLEQNPKPDSYNSGITVEHSAKILFNRTPWPLVLLGDGELRSMLLTLCSSLKLTGHVLLPGFIQYPELPKYYSRAGAFIHTSTTEQWGLVVNEAMASGLPVLVSNRCGCAPDLVQEGANGWTFDPTNEDQLSQLMLKVSTLNSIERAALGKKSTEIIANWGPERFAEGLRQAVECALRVGPKSAGLTDRALLGILARR